MADPSFMLDSNICICLLNDSIPVLSRRVREQAANTLCVSAISLAEIARGYGDTVFTAPDLAAFTRDIAVAQFSEMAAKIYGTLPFRRASFDYLIAAHALSLDVTFVTNNERGFAAMPNLKLENWTL